MVLRPTGLEEQLPSTGAKASIWQIGIRYTIGQAMMVIVILAHGLIRPPTPRDLLEHTS
jgi:hypothetical protein